MKIKRISKIGAALLAILTVCLMLGSVSAFAATTPQKEVPIPVTATGADCTAVLYDAGGTELQRLPLKDGETKSFTVSCEGLNTLRYSIRLAETDTATTTYDKTEYKLEVELYWGDNDTVTYSVTADPIGVLGDEGSNKAQSIEFKNTTGSGGGGGGGNNASVTVKKVWANTEGDDHPASVKISLLRDGAVIETVTLNEANQWTYTWRNLARNGRYSVSEPEVPEGYTASVSADGNVFTVTNTKTPITPPDTTEVSVKKVWANTDGTHPDSVKVNLLRDGQTVETVTLNEANGWAYTWKELAAGSYSVSESDVPEGYTVSISADGTSYTITNTKTPDEPEPNKPDEPDKPEPGKPGNPDNPSTPDKPGNPGTPKTGDESNITMWFSISVASFMCLILMIFLAIRNRRRERAEK